MVTSGLAAAAAAAAVAVNAVVAGSSSRGSSISTAAAAAAAAAAVAAAVSGSLHTVHQITSCRLPHSQNISQASATHESAGQNAPKLFATEILYARRDTRTTKQRKSEHQNLDETPGLQSKRVRGGRAGAGSSVRGAFAALTAAVASSLSGSGGARHFSSSRGKGSRSSSAALTTGANRHSAAAFGSKGSARAAAAASAAGAGINASAGAAPGRLWAVLTLVCNLLLLSWSSCMLCMIGSMFLDGSRMCTCIAGARRAAHGSPRAARATGGSLGQHAGGAPRQHAGGGGGKNRLFSKRPA